MLDRRPGGRSSRAFGQHSPFFRHARRGNGAFPGDREAFPRGNTIFSGLYSLRRSLRAPFPVGNASFPTVRTAFPTLRAAFPRGNGGKRVDRGARKVGNGPR